MIKIELENKLLTNLKYKPNILVLGNNLYSVIEFLQEKYVNIYIYDVKNNICNKYDGGYEKNDESYNFYDYNLDIDNNSINGDIFFDYILINDTLKNSYVHDFIHNIKFYAKNGTRVFISIKNEIGIKRLLKKFSDGNVELTNLDIDILKKYLIENNFNIMDFKYNFYNCSKREKKIIEELCSIIGNKYNSDKYMIDDYFIESVYLDKKIYESDDMINLKYMLMRIDNGYHVNNFSDLLIELFKKHDRELVFHLEYLVMLNVTNKGRIIEKIDCNREIESIAYLKHRLNLLK